MACQKLPTAIFAVAESELDQRRSDFWNDSERIQSFSSPKWEEPRWKAMHRPDWIHGEPEDFIRSGKYNFAIRKGTTPESLVKDIAVGDRIVIEARTMKGKKKSQLDKPRSLKYWWVGTITTIPKREKNQGTSGGCRNNHDHRAKHPLYYFCIDWDKEGSKVSCTSSPPCPAGWPCKTFTRFH